MKAFAVVAALAGLVVVPACGPAAPAAHHHQPAGATPSALSTSPTQTATSPAATLSVTAAFSPTDLAWIGLMIPMDEQLLRVLSMAEQQASEPALRTLATRLTAGHQAELVKLRQLRTRAGAPTANQHEGHDMPGMMTEPEVEAMGKTRGAAFDRLFEKNLREHLQQSVVVAKSVKTAGHDRATRDLAAAVETSRTAQLQQLGSSAN